MAKLIWDASGERRYETGVDHGVLYVQALNGTYPVGVAWNGLTTVTETPSGGESNPQYADNMKYLNLTSAEDFGGTIEAFTAPDEWAQCDGLAQPAPGLTIGQQGRKTFGFSYRTKIGNDVAGSSAGYKIHLVYGATAKPSERAYSTINDSPEAINFSWEISTVPVPVTVVNDLEATASLTVSSLDVDPATLAELEAILYGSGGTPGTAARLPLPDEVITLLAA